MISNQFENEMISLENPLIQKDKASEKCDSITLAWQDLSVHVMVKDSNTKTSALSRLQLLYNQKTRMKRILNSVSGFIQSGTLVAIMGSSGAGKSTLMSTLAYRNSPGTTIQGEILINGQTIGPKMHEISGFVYQEDIFIGTLTVREHLSYMIQLKLRKKMAKPEINAKILEVTKRAGLHKNCLERKIGGDDMKKVLSGGEKKRLSFATELISDPLILFCDEPTTGLDSFNAQHIVETLKGLAKQGTLTICTIHQPSRALFCEFDQVLLLADGRVTFYGSPHQAIDFFEAPEMCNPAEFLISSISNRTENRAKKYSDLFAVTKLATTRDHLIDLEFSKRREDSSWSKRSRESSFSDRLVTFWIIISLLAQRGLLNIRRNPTIQTMRFLQKIAIAITCGLCFSGALRLDQLGVQAIQGAIFITVSENSFHPMYSVLSTFPNDFPIFIREHKNGLYSTLQYYLANILGMLPGFIVEPCAFVCIFYFLSGFRYSVYGFLMTAVVAFLVMNVATACGYFFSVTFNSVPFAMAALVPFDYLLMITSGVFVQLSSLPAFLQWLKYISWFMYGTESLSIIHWEGVQNITCPEDLTLPCIETGEEVLDRYSFDMGNLTRDLSAMLVLYCIFHVLGMIFLYRRTKT